MAIKDTALNILIKAKDLVSILQTGDKFERLRVQLENVMGSIEGGQQATDWIKEFTKSTPYQLERNRSGELVFVDQSNVVRAPFGKIRMNLAPQPTPPGAA